MTAPTESKNFSALTALGAAPATDDELLVSDTSEAVATDKPKRMTVANVITLLQTAFAALAAQFQTIELGHATDTTLSRSAAGAVAVEGKVVALNDIALPHTASVVELEHASDTTLSRVSAGLAAIEGVPIITAPAPNNQTGTTYELVLADANRPLTLNNASPITLTIPANGAVAFPIGSFVPIMQLGAGQVTVAITSDTLNVNATFQLKLAGQHSVAGVYKKAATTWVLFGDLALV